MSRSGDYKKQESEMAVITQAKELSKYIFQVTQNAPKKFRFSLIHKLQTLSTDVISAIYEANECFVPKRDAHEVTPAFYLERFTRRLDHGFMALTHMKQLDHLVIVAREMQCISAKQHEQLASRIWNVRNLLGAWLKSERRRFS
jgi:hypothetical protein